MITIFNRAEVYTALSADERDEMAARLGVNGVEFKIKTVMKAVTEPDPESGGKKTRSAIAYRYRFYVHRRDWDYARQVIK